MKRAGVALLVVLAVFLLSSTSVESYFDAASGKTVDVISGEVLVAVPADSSAKTLNSLLSRHNLSLEREMFSYEGRKWIVANINDGKSVSDKVRELEASGDFVKVQPNFVYRLLATLPNDPEFSKQTWLKSEEGTYGIKADSAWDFQRGNAVVAVIDTGYDNAHPELSGKLYGWGDYNSSSNRCDQPCDYDGHGTCCAGIIGANTNNDLGVAGVCWGCSIVALRVFPESSSDRVASAIHDAADISSVKVISMSLGAYGVDPAEQDAVEYAWSKGKFLVAAAGNDNVTDKLYPAAYEHVMAVAALSPDRTKAGFSNYGDWVDISAPGVNVYTVDIHGSEGYSAGDYTNFAGTSAATPVVAGVAALLMSERPDFGPQEVWNALVSTADSSIYDVNPEYQGELGAGLVNAERVIISNLRDNIPPDTLFKSAEVDGVSKSYTEINGVVLNDPNVVEIKWGGRDNKDSEDFLRFSYRLLENGKEKIGWTTWSSVTNYIFTKSFLNHNAHYVLMVRSMDSSGNVDPNPLTVEFTVVVTGGGGGGGESVGTVNASPNTVLLYAPTTVDLQSMVSMFWKGWDDGEIVGYEYRLDNGGWTFTSATSWESPAANLGVGTHTFAVRAIDNYGEKDPTPATVTFSVSGVATTAATNMAMWLVPDYSQSAAGVVGSDLRLTFNVFVSDPRLSIVSVTLGWETSSGSVTKNMELYSVNNNVYTFISVIPGDEVEGQFMNIFFQITYLENGERKTVPYPSTGVLPVSLVQSPGDLNFNGIIDPTDLSVIEACFNSSWLDTGAGIWKYSPNKDLNGDGQIDERDILGLMAKIVE